MQRMRVFFFISLCSVGTLGSANQFFVGMAGGYQSSVSQALQATTEPVSGATTLDIASTKIAQENGYLQLVTGYRWQWQQNAITEDMSLDQTQFHLSQAPILADAALPANQLISDGRLQTMLFNTRWNYFFMPRWSSVLIAGLGVSRSSTDNTMYFAAPPLAPSASTAQTFYRLTSQAGIGIEYALDTHWQLGSEFLYRRYGNMSLGTFYANPPVTSGVQLSIPRYSASLVLMTLTYNLLEI